MRQIRNEDPKMVSTRAINPAFSCLSTVLLAAILPPVARPDVQVVDAPPLGNARIIEQEDVGLWDDAFVCDGQDIVILRRGDDLFSRSMSSRPQLIKLATVPQVRASCIVAGTRWEDSLWLFCESADSTPFAVEAYSGRVAEFDIPGVIVPGERAPSIQSHVIIPEAGGAILMVEGGDRKTWPRDGNRPVYFWIGLESGQAVRLPIGWDLEYFSADQRLAVFDTPRENIIGRRPLRKRPRQAIDMRTGATLEQLPQPGEQYGVPFRWPETQRVKPLCVFRPETGDIGRFIGVSMGGRAYPFDTPWDIVRHLSTAAERDGFVGFRVRREGKLTVSPSSFWIAQLREKTLPEHVQDDVIDFAMLSHGQCVFVTGGRGHKGTSAEAFVYGHATRTAWIPLQGVEGLPALDPEFADMDYVEDRMTVQLTASFGSSAHDALVLCVFTHTRGDMRVLPAAPKEERLEISTWQRALIVTSTAERFMTDIFREDILPERLWLHDSGRMLVGTGTWQKSGARRQRKLQLRQLVLDAPQGHNQREIDKAQP
jgi:hypothetical protein